MVPLDPQAASTESAVEPEAAARIGTVVSGRYRIEKVIGEGGIGSVFRAEDIVLKTPAAVKLLKREVSEDTEVVARFDREARMMLALSHENIVRALNYGRTPEGDICLVLEFVDGETLRARYRRTKPFPAPLAASVISQLGHALAHAHAQNIVHRDLKPENVMLVPRGDDQVLVKVLDFGMARILHGPSGAATFLTRKGAVFGTPEYMSPEQAMGQPVDARSDQYALGVMAFEMIAGQRPFRASGPLEMVQMQIKQDAPSILDVEPLAPPRAAPVVARMLAKKPSDRFADVREAANGLAQALGLDVPSVNAPAAMRKWWQVFGSKK